MSRTPRKGRLEQYEAYRDASGWYLAAWRDFRGLTLEELAAELSISKGYASDLETGAPRSGRNPTRFNRETVKAAAAALNTTGGRLIDVNPWNVDQRALEVENLFKDLDPVGQEAVFGLITTLKGTGT